MTELWPHQADAADAACAELVDVSALALGPVADHALRDAISRWWAQEDPHGTVEGFAAVGLRVTQE